MNLDFERERKKRGKERKGEREREEKRKRGKGSRGGKDWEEMKKQNQKRKQWCNGLALGKVL